MENILEQSAEKALEFFLDSDSYVDFDLPAYFQFGKMLEKIQERVGDRPYEECCQSSPADCEKVNLEMLTNKDGHFAVRPLSIVNPYLYYFLVREMCEAENWSKIQTSFKSFAVPTIQPLAIPLKKLEKEEFPKSGIILHWWKGMEQQSIALSLEYRYMFVTDITNCYGSVLPNSIEWALNRKNTSRETTENTGLAKSICKIIHDMQGGRNVGMPQGSQVFDLIAEMILGYADLLLYEKIEDDETVTDTYKILRYRDDYRIFCNDKKQLERITSHLQKVLETFNFRMNTSKTKTCDSIITDSIKSDKLAYISGGPICKVSNKKVVWCAFAGFQKHLLYILQNARQFPNSGQLKVRMSEFGKRLDQYKESHKSKLLTLSENPNDNVWKDSVVMWEDKQVMIAIATQIAMENMVSASNVLEVISKLVDLYDKESPMREKILRSVYGRLKGLRNSDYLQVWLQNLTFSCRDLKYDSLICRLVAGEDVGLWNNSWLKPEVDMVRISAIEKEDGPALSFLVDDQRRMEVGDQVMTRQRFAYDHLDEIENLIEGALMDVPEIDFDSLPDVFQ